uniref:Putative dual specificity protein phosphatase n=1 Tax=Trypanosoma vivax (strain Y486) TaxID=1055687 RepID=G0TRX9_TRYVY|nr:putative dual specificity protein phosphatase [Trypanosoma vivax Y486]
MLPMDLSQSKIYLEDTRVYLLIHVQRLPLCPVSAGATTTTSTTVSGATGKTTVRTPSTQLGGSSSQYGGSGDVVVPPTFDRVPGESEVVWRPTDAAPEWASAQSEVFTPRGLASPFSTSVGMPPVGVPVATSRSSEKDGVSGFEFRYSIYIYKGCKAHPMVAAVAAMHAGRIEEKFLSDEETLHRLFFNFNPSSWRGEEESPRRDSSPWSTIGEVTRKRAVRRTTRMCDEFQRNALVRVLCCLRRSSTSRNTLATPNSRGSTSQDCTPRGCTKRKNIIPALSFDYYMLHQPRDRPLRPLPLKAMGTFKATLPVGSGCDAKGRPLLQTSRAHYRALDPSGTLKEELPIPRTRNNNFMSHISNGQGDTSRVSNASSHTSTGLILHISTVSRLCFPLLGRRCCRR